MLELSPLQKSRTHFMPVLPRMLATIETLSISEEEKGFSVEKEVERLFPHTHALPHLTFIMENGVSRRPLRVGVVLSGGQAPGGHNVIIGLFDALQKLHPESELIGFHNGPAGLIDDRGTTLTKEFLSTYRNQGGFDLIGSGRTKIETKEQFEKVAHTARERRLDGLVIIGGDDSNTNAALLAEYFLENQVATAVVGVPKTIDGDLKNAYIETSFGFDTACKTYAETIGSICRDALSAKKYYFFIRLMGRSASHIALECALQTHPNETLIGEEIAAKSMTIRQIIEQLADTICSRAEEGKDFGVILIPEGIIEFIPEFRRLIQALNTLLAKGSETQKEFERGETMKERIAYVIERLTGDSQGCFSDLPAALQEQLLLDRDPHGNVQVAKIETERFFMAAVTEELIRRKERGEYRGKFSAQPLYLGYEGRSCLPSNFDAQYCYALGHVAALLIDQKKTGYMSAVRNLTAPVIDWLPAGIPIVEMMTLETREGREKPVIEKALVDLEGKPFALFSASRNAWRIDDAYRNPGPIQFAGDSEVTESITATLALEQAGR